MQVSDLKIFVAGNGKMFESVVSGLCDSGIFPVGVLRHSKIELPGFLLFLTDFFAPDISKILINKYKLNEINVKGLNDEKFADYIKKEGIQAVFIASWSEKLKKEVLSIQNCPIINIHPSLLPEYRGPNPYSAVILNREDYSGVTFHLMNENWDEGDILYQFPVKVSPAETGGTLREKCAFEVKNRIAAFIVLFLDGKLNPRKQSEKNASYFPAIKAKDLIVDFKTSGFFEIERKFRAFHPWNKLFIPINNRFLSFEKITEDGYTNFNPGQIVGKGKNYVRIVCKDGIVAKFSGIKVLGKKFFGRFYAEKILKTSEFAG